MGREGLARCSGAPQSFGGHSSKRPLPDSGRTWSRFNTAVAKKSNQWVLNVVASKAVKGGSGLTFDDWESLLSHGQVPHRAGFSYVSGMCSRVWHGGSGDPHYCHMYVVFTLTL